MADNKYNLYITNYLSFEEKREFYNAAMNNDLELFKTLLSGDDTKEPYSIFEEVSGPGYNWTVFHYAMQYGKWEIIKFIIEYLSENDMIDIAFNIKTSGNRCPMLCLLKSDALSLKEKKELYFKIVNSFQIPLNEEVIDEANKIKIYEDKEANKKKIYEDNEANKKKIYEDNEANKRNIYEEKKIIKIHI